MSPGDSDSLLALLSEKMVKGGRLAYWNLYIDRYPPASNSRMKLLDDTSQKLYAIDRVFHYIKFCVIQIV